MSIGKKKPEIKVLRRALEHVEGEVVWGESLANLTSLQVGGPADVLVMPSDLADLLRVIQGAKAHGVSYLVLGGTNVVVRDKGIRGIVIQLKHLTKIREEDGQVIYAQAGIRLPRLMQFAVSRRLAGMEWAAGIPGTVGGAVVMNAGTRLGEMKDVLSAVDMVNARGKRVRLEAADLVFEYRKTTLPKGIVVGAWLQLQSSSRQAIESVAKEYLQYRKSTQPLTQPNAGSVFVNPPGDSAGRLVEAAGLKGFRIGDAEVSKKHGNFIVNRGVATAEQVLSVIRKVRQVVFKKFGVRLQLELKVLGEV